MKVNFILFLFLIACSENRVKEEFYESGQLKESMPYKGEVLHGHFEAYSENGSLQGTGEFVEGIMVGVWKYWYKNGKLLSEATYDEKGKLINLQAWDESGEQVVIDCTGIAIMRYPNGKPKTQIAYKNCELDGQWLYWDENGTLIHEFFYEEGVPVGVWKQWDPDGTLRRTEQQGPIKTERKVNE